MDSRIKDLIIQLQNKITDYQKDIDNLQGTINDLKNKPHTSSSSDIFDKREKELGELRIKLHNTTQERDNIRDLFGKKIEELNTSNLSKEDKAEQITKLMTGEYQQLKTSCQKLTKLWEDFGKARDNLLELEKSLSNSRLEAIRSLEQTKSNQWTIIWVLLGVIITLSLSLSLLFVSLGQKKERTKKNSQGQKN